MSNSVRIIFSDEALNGKKMFSPVVYFHWNGSTDKVVAFLKQLEKIGFHDSAYACARFCQSVGNFLDDFGRDPSNLGVGLENFDGKIENVCDSDNGIFVVSYKPRTGMVVTRYQHGDRLYNELLLEQVYEMLTPKMKQMCDRICALFDKNRVLPESE